MTSFLTLVSTLVWWVLYSSIAALACALVALPVLRWSERAGVVFNRVYFACLLWCLASAALLLVLMFFTASMPHALPGLVHTGVGRGLLVADMVLGALLLWRLVPRIDAHRVRPASAMFAAAAVIAVTFGLMTSLA